MMSQPLVSKAADPASFAGWLVSIWLISFTKRRAHSRVGRRRHRGTTGYNHLGWERFDCNLHDVYATAGDGYGVERPIATENDAGF